MNSGSGTPKLGRRLLIASTVLALVSGGLVTGIVAWAATAGCRVTYAVTNQWPGGFGANVTVANLGDAVNGWRLTWSFPAGQQITQAWNATVSQSGGQVSASSLPYNSTIASGGTVAFGFNGTWNGSNPVPTDFALGGVPCTGDTTSGTGNPPATTRTPGPTTASPPTSNPPTSPPATSGPPVSTRIRGGDVSSLKKNEDFGAVYYTGSGTRADALQILRSSGMNWARLKVWVNPADGYNNKTRVLEMAKRIKGQGMGLLIDFHYSDSWADPGKQVKPVAWQGYSFAQLKQAVYDHTYDLLNALKAQGATADMVQIGNEINPGMLLPDGSSDNFANLAELLKSGISAAKAVSSSTRIMLHLAEGANNTQHRWWFDQAVARGVPFDVIGLSHYIYWHGSVSALQSNMNDLASRYNKDIVVAETAYGFSLGNDDGEPNIFNSSLQQAGGYPASTQGQADAFRAVVRAVASVPNGRGLGVFYWEPAWTAVRGSGWDPANPSSGDSWDNQALFDFNDRPLPAMAVFGG